MLIFVNGTCLNNWNWKCFVYYIKTIIWTFKEALWKIKGNKHKPQVIHWDYRAIEKKKELRAWTCRNPQIPLCGFIADTCHLKPHVSWIGFMRTGLQRSNGKPGPGWLYWAKFVTWSISPCSTRPKMKMKWYAPSLAHIRRNYGAKFSKCCLLDSFIFVFPCKQGLGPSRVNFICLPCLIKVPREPILGINDWVVLNI